MLTTITLLAVASDIHLTPQTSIPNDGFEVGKSSNTSFFGAFSCPAGSIDEGEGCEGDINDLCFGASGAPGFISDGQTICGNLFTTTDTTDPANPVDTRDLDWFLFTHSGGAIDMTFAAEADMFVTVIPYDATAPAFCDTFTQLITFTYAPADGERAEQVFTDPGTYMLVAYAIDFDGYDCNAGDFAYYLSASSDPNAVCAVSAQAGDDVEAEVCETDTNGGCNNLPDPATYENISEGVPFVGTLWSGLDVDGDGEVDGRDTDWMLYDHPGGSIEYTIVADTEEVIGLIVDISDCAAASVVFATDIPAPCIPVTSVSGYLAPAQYAIWAGIPPRDTGEVDADGNPIFETPVVPCSNYRATVVSDTSVEPPASCDDPVGTSCDQPDSTYPVDGIGLYVRNGVFCGNPTAAPGGDYINSYQADEIAPVPGEPFTISCLEVAIANFDGENAIQIQIWDDTDGGDPTGYNVDLSPLTDQLCVLSDAGPGMYSVPLPSPVEVAAGSTLCISMSHTEGNGNSVITYGMTQDYVPGVDSRPWTTYLFNPACGDTGFTSVDALGFTGLDWDLQINFGGEVSLPCPTDLDNDGDTDFNDILLVLSNWGTDGAAGGDADENGTVDFNDLILLLSAFGPCP